ncbi:MAG: LysE family transporter [Proteobacteria bacterium]|nr:LysE family transporter [Pseudomonadota bacterium]
MALNVWLTLFVAAWLISLSPGSGAVAAMSAGASHGFARATHHTVGLVLGLWTQVLVVGLGLGALLAASELAFAAVKWVGVAYLLWLGIQAWRNKAGALRLQVDGGPASPRALMWRGWAVNAVNPKGTLFLLAVVPQFVNPAAALGPQYLVIGATLGLTELVVMSGYTLLATQMLRLLRGPQAMRWVERAFGSLFIAVALALAAVKRPS